MSKTRPSRLGTAYLLTVPVAGIAVLATAGSQLLAAPPPVSWLALTLVTAFTGAYTVKIPGLVVRFSVSEPIVFLSTLLYGPAAGTITAAVDALVMSLRLLPHLRTIHRILFNIGTVAIAIYVAGHLYFRLAGLDLHEPSYGPLATFVGPLYVFAGAAFAINSGLVATALAAERHSSPVAIWRKQFLWLSVTYLSSASVAAILITLADTLNLALIGLLLPLVVVSFVAVRTTLGRLDDANQHLAEVNQLYLSTIETLAMAVDAKDQVTHGHIRRVQKFTVALAKLVGVTDDRQLKAIEAAALLHDMGKLAIPEFILNKPGKLTPSEFAVMKTHASLGADILSSIRFPYPVVPIVRHHHEHWDGTGYPDGLKGPAIPLGARILSVIDCYDALTSDRPYRPAMSDAQAVSILLQRRGYMYDPLVVDTFVASLPDLQSADADSKHIVNIAAPLRDEPDRTDISIDAPTVSSLRMLSAMVPLPPGRSAESVARDAIAHLRCLAPFDSAILFIGDDAELSLSSLFIDGSLGDSIEQLRIPYADKLTGWVAAYRTSVWNSDAALDLGAKCPPDMAYASSLPLEHNSDLVGVLTIYGKTGQDVSPAQRRALEQAIVSVPAVLEQALSLGPRAIDARRQDIAAAGLAILDNLLSHPSGPTTSAAVVAVELRDVPSDQPRRSKSDDSAISTLARHILKGHASRQCLVLSANGCIFCDTEQHSKEELQRHIESAILTPDLQALAATIVPVYHSHGLHVVAQRLSKHNSVRGTSRDDSRQVH